MSRTIRVTVSAEYLVQSALEAAGEAGIPNADKGDFIVDRLIKDGYSIREADAPSKAEWNALMDRLEERDLYWEVPSAGEATEGALREGPPEPPVGAVVIDRAGDAWQRRQYPSTWQSAGSSSGGCTWTGLRRDYGPLTLLAPAVSS